MQSTDESFDRLVICYNILTIYTVTYLFTCNASICIASSEFLVTFLRKVADNILEVIMILDVFR